MWKRNHCRLLGLILLLASIQGCEDTQSYPDTPEISFHSFSVRSSEKPTAKAIGTLTINFTDGNADIGFLDTTTVDTFNLYLTTYYRSGTTYQTKYPPTGYRIPAVPKSSYKPYAKGQIALQVPFLSLPKDSLKFSLFLYDRAGLKSNTIQTPAAKVDLK